VEWVVLATVMVLGIFPGLVAIRQGALAELLDVANAALGLDQSYGCTGQETGCGQDALPAAVARNNRVLQAALRVGAVQTSDARGKQGPLNEEKQGGIQAYSAGSGFLESRRLGQADGIVNQATPANSSVKKTWACD
jgi:hypothetical protein